MKKKNKINTSIDKYNKNQKRDKQPAHILVFFDALYFFFRCPLFCFFRCPLFFRCPTIFCFFEFIRDFVVFAHQNFPLFFYIVVLRITLPSDAQILIRISETA